MNCPILLVVFNRPAKVSALIAGLSAIKPRHIYIAADGPRPCHRDDPERCAAVRELVSKLPWDCELKTNFQPTNLGCKRGVSTAIDWFFSHVEAGIILEDDCIPSPVFFDYCAELLQRHAQSEQVMHISGTTFIGPRDQAERSRSYHFSRIALVWGWATWRRAWQRYDIEMRDIDGLRAMLDEENAFSARRYRAYWTSLFRHTEAAAVDTWDAQWQYSILKARGLCITPVQNLIENIGFDQDATHTTAAVPHARGVGAVALPLVHPDAVLVDTAADARTMRTAYVNRLRKHLRYHIRSYLKD